MLLSSIGKQVKEQWLKTFELRPDMNLKMGEYVIMPNHFHAIIHIGKNKYKDNRGGNRRDALQCVSTSGNNSGNIIQNKFGPQSKNLAAIVRGFKGSVNRFVRKNGNPNFGWQTRFYEHIIRNKNAYFRIEKYIINNPMNWNKDKFHS